MVNRKIAFEKLNLKVPLTYGRIKQITGVSKPTLCKWAIEFKKNGTW